MISRSSFVLGLAFVLALAPTPGASAERSPAGADTSGPASFEAAPSFLADAPLPPVLHFYEELDSFMAPDFTLLKRLRTSELTLVPTTGMHHVHFTTYGFVMERFPALAAATKATAATAAEVRKVEQATIDFLERKLR